MQNNMNVSSGESGMRGEAVVPFAMEVASRDGQGFHVFVCDFDPGFIQP
jgi:hypothetical protein